MASELASSEGSLVVGSSLFRGTLSEAELRSLKMMLSEASRNEDVLSIYTADMLNEMTTQPEMQPASVFKEYERLKYEFWDARGWDGSCAVSQHLMVVKMVEIKLPWIVSQRDNSPVVQIAVITQSGCAIKNVPLEFERGVRRYRETTTVTARLNETWVLPLASSPTVVPVIIEISAPYCVAEQWSTEIMDVMLTEKQLPPPPRHQWHKQSFSPSAFSWRSLTCLDHGLCGALCCSVRLCTAPPQAITRKLPVTDTPTAAWRKLANKLKPKRRCAGPPGRLTEQAWLTQIPEGLSAVDVFFEDSQDAIWVWTQPTQWSRLKPNRPLLAEHEYMIIAKFASEENGLWS